MRQELPTGTVTFLFTDIEGSTRLLNELGADRYADALATHRALIRGACLDNGGVEVDTQGDAFFFVFPTAPNALAAASSFTESLGANGPIRVRVGIHTGTPLVGEEGYIGHDVHRAARIAGAGHGGQVLVSASTASLVDTELTDLGEHRFKDLAAPERVFQLGGATFPALRSLHRTNLPIPSTAFLGREHELQAVTALVARQDARLVTLTGPGGTGKTRLALEAAAAAAERFPDGVWWVALAPLRDPALVTETIAESLEAKEELASHIAERRMLLLLDNMEQVIESAPDLSALIAACPNLTLLVTSRELLRVQGELDYPVPPLAEREAVDLFCARSGLAPSEEVIELCRRLDDLPLAIELAAARTRALTVSQILERLSQRLDLLKGGRDADPRQHTLRATIGWSFDLLTPEEQGLFARLSVFADGCTLDAAEQVCDADLDTLQSLVEKSLLRFSPAESGGRYWMLETVREYAAEAVSSRNEEEVFRRRHAQFFTTLAVTFEREIKGGEQASWWQRLTEEYSNIRAALTWACAGGNARSALELTYALRVFWVQRGAYHEGELWYEAALAIGADEPPRLRARATRGLANMAHGTGDLEAALALLDECLGVCRSERDEALELDVLVDLGMVYSGRGDTEEAQESWGEALELARSLGDVRAAGITTFNLGESFLIEGDLDLAEAMFEDALVASRQLGHEHSTAYVLMGLATVDLRRGDGGHGAPRIVGSIARFRERDDRVGLVGALIVGGALIALRGAEAAATTALALSTSLRKETDLDLRVYRVEAGIYEETLAALRSRVGEASFEKLWSRGLEGGRDALLDEVLAALK